MELCPVCNHGMLVLGTSLNETLLIFECPICHYLKNRQLPLSSKSSVAKKCVVFGLAGYHGTATNGGESAVYLKEKDRRARCRADNRREEP